MIMTVFFCQNRQKIRNCLQQQRNRTITDRESVHYKIPKSEMVLLGSQKLQDDNLLLVFVNKISATLLAEQLFVDVGCKGGFR